MPKRTVPRRRPFRTGTIPLRDSLREDILKGATSEARVSEALQYLASQDKILGYIDVPKDHRLDQVGIDRLIIPGPSPFWCIPLQVKSSWSGKNQYLIKNGLRIPVLVVPEYASKEDLAQKILELVGLNPDRRLPPAQ